MKTVSWTPSSQSYVSDFVSRASFVDLIMLSTMYCGGRMRRLLEWRFATWRLHVTCTWRIGYVWDSIPGHVPDIISNVLSSALLCGVILTSDAPCRRCRLSLRVYPGIYCKLTGGRLKTEVLIYLKVKNIMSLSSPGYRKAKLLTWHGVYVMGNRMICLALAAQSWPINFILAINLFT